MSNSKLKVKTTSMPNSRLAVELEIPAQECKTSYEDALSRLSKSAKLPGFRQGKVPKAVILQQFGIKRIQASALEKLLEKIWSQALEQESIEPLCEPELKEGFEHLLTNFNPEKTLTITLETDIAPTPTLKVFKGLTAEVDKITFDPKKVDELIEQSRKQLATLVPIENRPAKKGDIAVVSFKGTYKENGSDIEGGSSDSMNVELEEGKMIPGFVKGIIGMSVNEEKDIECEFPEDYSDEKARGKKANFHLKLKDLKYQELPELNDSFAQQASDKATMQELRKELEDRLKEDTKHRQKVNRQDSLIKVLVEQLEVEIPKTMIDQEVRSLIEQTARNFAEQGIDVKSTFTQELVNSLMESSRPEAIDNLRKNLALNAIAKSENIEVNDKELEEKIEIIKKDIPQNQNIDEKRLKEAVLDDLIREKVFIWLEENNTIKEKEIDKKEVTPKKTSTKTKGSKASSSTTKLKKTTQSTPKT